MNLSTPQTFTITVNPVNHAPSFTKGPNQTVPEDSGAQIDRRLGHRTQCPGPASESSQTLNFLVSNNDTALFSVQPAISPRTGRSTYTPAPGTSGTATVTVALHDNGGAANGGVRHVARRRSSRSRSARSSNRRSSRPDAAGGVRPGCGAEATWSSPCSPRSMAGRPASSPPPSTGATVRRRPPGSSSRTAPRRPHAGHVQRARQPRLHGASGAFTITVSIVDLNGGSPVTASNVAVANGSASGLTAAARSGERLRPVELGRHHQRHDPDRSSERPCRARS